MTTLRESLHDTLPYEKCLMYGPKALSSAELLAVLLRSGTRNSNCLKVAENILALSGRRGLLGLKHLGIEELCSIEGIGTVRAVMLSCVAELSERIATSSLPELPQFQDSDAVARYYMERMRHLEKEHFFLLMLNTKCALLHETVLSVGTVNFTAVSQREIFREALKAGAVYIMVLHNHPSGDPSPSREDISVTQTISQAGKLIGIPLLDHIIIGDRRYVSLKEKKLI